MLRDRAFNDLDRPLSVEQAAAVQGCSWRSRQQALVFLSNDLTGRRANWAGIARREKEGIANGCKPGADA